MFGMGSRTRTTTPPPGDDLTTVLRVLRKHTRILSNMHHDANESHEELMKKLGRLEAKVDTCIDDVRGYREEQRKLRNELTIVEEMVKSSNASQ